MGHLSRRAQYLTSRNNYATLTSIYKGNDEKSRLSQEFTEKIPLAERD